MEFIDPKKLVRVKNYVVHLRQATNRPLLTNSAVYKMIREGRLSCIEIDGVKFIHKED